MTARDPLAAATPPVKSGRTPAQGTVERRGSGYWLIVGLLFIFFPIWLAFVASTLSQAEIMRPPMPLLPGDRFFDNYRKALVSRASTRRWR